MKIPGGLNRRRYADCIAIGGAILSVTIPYSLRERYVDKFHTLGKLPSIYPIDMEAILLQEFGPIFEKGQKLMWEAVNQYFFVAVWVVL